MVDHPFPIGLIQIKKNPRLEGAPFLLHPHTSHDWQLKELILVSYYMGSYDLLIFTSAHNEKVISMRKHLLTLKLL